MCIRDSLATVLVYRLVSFALMVLIGWILVFVLFRGSEKTSSLELDDAAAGTSTNDTKNDAKDDAADNTADDTAAKKAAATGKTSHTTDDAAHCQ